MAVKTIMSLTEKRYSLGFIAALLTAVAVLFFQISSKDKKIEYWVSQHIECQKDKIIRLDKALEENKEMLLKTQHLLKINDSILKIKFKK